MEEKTVHAALNHFFQSNPKKIVLFTTGGGGAALQYILSTPGASNCLLEASVPYCRESLEFCLNGQIPDKYCSAKTAFNMAVEAFKRCLDLGSSPFSSVGISCTAALISSTVRKGTHRCFVGVCTAEKVVVSSYVFDKGSRNRFEEDSLCGLLVTDALLKHAANPPAVPHQLPIPLTPTDTAEVSVLPAEDYFTALHEGVVNSITVVPAGSDPALSRVPVYLPDYRPANPVILPGSFNPLHIAHVSMAQQASQLVRRTVLYELCIANADKGLLNIPEIHKRLAFFFQERPEELPMGSFGGVVVTRDTPLFVSKTSLFKNSVFVVGHDTAVRLVDEKYYGGPDGLTDAFATMKKNGASFLVAGRVDQKGQNGSAFFTLEHVNVPPAFEAMFHGLPRFRMDLSSSQIRAGEASRVG
eukprot:GCRY01004562.1.p1 GENE.GCRY01004562.1~~GCRY01004562.1.p1  ORF type:complete len:414 (+),score=77.10 GCRY01004562.1:293-1534(+)